MRTIIRIGRIDSIKMNSIKLLFASLLLLLGLIGHAFASPSYYSYETVSNSIDDGRNVIKDVKTSKSKEPQINRKIMFEPSMRSMNSIIARRQKATNQIGIGLESNPMQAFLRKFKRRGNLRRGFISRARTVESPALSVDSGGQKKDSVAMEMAKLLNLNPSHGHYADIYKTNMKSLSI